MKSMDEHREAAAAHRKASAALRSAEATACAGISIADRDMGPFEHPDEISGVEPFVQNVSGSKGQQPRQMGAIVTFRAVPGLTVEWLQRSVDCQIARSAALGYVVPEMPDCPLIPKGVEAHVRSSGTGFKVEIRSDDPTTAREILARADRFAATAAR